MIMFYENNNSLVLKLLGVAVYCYIEKYVYVDYFCLQREENMSSLHRLFEILHLMSSKNLSYQKFYEKWCRFMVIFKTKIQHLY